MKFVKNTVTNKFEFIPADSARIDTNGMIQHQTKENPGLFGQQSKPGKELKEILPDFREQGLKGLLSIGVLNGKICPTITSRIKQRQ